MCLLHIGRNLESEFYNSKQDGIKEESIWNLSSDKEKNL